MTPEYESDKLIDDLLRSLTQLCQKIDTLTEVMAQVYNMLHKFDAIGIEMKLRDDDLHKLVSLLVKEVKLRID